MSLRTRRARLGHALAVLLVGALAPLAQAVAAPQASEAERYRAQAQRARTRLEALSQEAKRLAAAERGLISELRSLDLERERRALEVERVEADLAAVTAERDEAAASAEAIEAQLDAERPLITGRLARLYMMGTRSTPRWWAGVAGVREAGRAWRMLSGTAGIDRRRVAGYNAKLTELEATRARLADRARAIEGLRVEVQAAKRAADAAAARQRARLRAVAERRELAEQMTGELARASERLQAAVAGLAVGPSPAPDALPLRAFRGALDWPSPGRLATRFGRQREARFGTMIVRNGVGIAASDGATVKAVHEGRVVFADAFAGFGRLVIVDHSRGAYSLYGNLGDVRVANGDRVDAGASLGTVGRSAAGESELYFELRIDGRPVDPLEWLKPWSEMRSGLMQ